MYNPRDSYRYFILVEISTNHYVRTKREYCVKFTIIMYTYRRSTKSLCRKLLRHYFNGSVARLDTPWKGITVTRTSSLGAGASFLVPSSPMEIV